MLCTLNGVCLFICSPSNNSQSHCSERGLLSREQNLFSHAPAVRKYSRIKKKMSVSRFPEVPESIPQGALIHWVTLLPVWSNESLFSLPAGYSLYLSQVTLMPILRQACIQRPVCTVLGLISVPAVYQLGENSRIVHAEYAQWSRLLQSQGSRVRNLDSSFNTWQRCQSLKAKWQHSFILFICTVLVN